MPKIEMLAKVANVFGRRMRYGVSSNAPFVLTHLDEERDREIVWVINLHGYFAGGGMYFRESAILANEFGICVLNPSLPGFGGSDPVPWEELSIASLAKRVSNLMDQLHIKRALVMGHSMGTAVAVQLASLYPEKVLGIIYRDGIATPSWKRRKSLIVDLSAPFLPDLAPFLDLVVGAAMDVPDILLGRLGATLRSIYPDFSRNVRTLGRTVPVAAVLLGSDLSGELESVVTNFNLPILPIWGAFDRISPPHCAKEFEELIGTKILWIPGAHSWMLARPGTQSAILRHHPRGRDFMETILARAELGSNAAVRKILSQ